jgi:hypothetical protein
VFIGFKRVVVAMRLVLLLALFLISVLNVVKTQEIVLDDSSVAVQGMSSSRSFKDTDKVVSSPPPSALLAPTSTLKSDIKPSFVQGKKPNSKTIPQQTLAKQIILNQTEEIKDDNKSWQLPKLNKALHYLLMIEYELQTTETLPKFDDPAFLVFMDDHLVYQQAASDPPTRTIKFNPRVYSSQPQVLKIWAGNSGDDQAQTLVKIKQIFLQPLINFPDSFSILPESIRDLTATSDENDYLTLEFTSPQSNSESINRALGYEVKFNSEPISLNNWDQSLQMEVVFPMHFSPHFPGNKEIILIRKPPSKAGYINMRSFSALGHLSSIGNNASFND